MGKADLHIHTKEGDGLDSIEAVLDHIETRTDLNVVAITEHDALEVGLEAREIWSRGGYRFDFIPGAEITTLEGHLIGLFLERPVPSLQRVEATIEAIHRQGGICVVPHPCSWLTRSIGPGTFARVLPERERGTWFDALELANASPAGRVWLSKARQLNESTYGLPEVGASDAHFVEAIGSAFTCFPGSSAIDLRRAVEGFDVSAHQEQFPSLRSVGFRRTLRLPVAGLCATPRRLGWRRTAWSFVSRYWA
jgi:predicted metal-dependent phosphoesterase TrpH